MAQRMDKDYYDILGVGPEANEAEIKKSYRRKALELHPDRNPGDPHSEERFKEVTEAYGVLIDPVKRRQYDSWRATGFDPQRTGGFDYRPEDIFREVFGGRGPAASAFEELMREFSRQGLRFDRPFVHRVFFPGFHGIFFGGAFVGPLNLLNLLRIFFPRQATERPRVEEAARGGGLLASLKRALTGQKAAQPVKASEAAQPHGKDLLYHLAVTGEEALRGAEKTILVRTNGRDERVQVKIPPGVRDGQKLRLRGKGHDGPPGSPRGDCYIALTITD